MILTLVNVVYVLVAVAMIALILLQRGAGAAAGSGFGAGASATVFGARGASNFLSKSTAILAAVFFAMSLGMAMYASRGSTAGEEVDLGIMGAAPVEEAPAAPVATFETPAAPTATAPATPAPAASDVPAAPVPEAATDSATPENPSQESDNGE